jgi:hypothetical protein
MTIVREVPQIVNQDFNELGVARLAHNAVIQRPAKKIRKDSQDLEFHLSS